MPICRLFLVEFASVSAFLAFEYAFTLAEFSTALGIGGFRLYGSCPECYSTKKTSIHREDVCRLCPGTLAKI